MDESRSRSASTIISTSSRNETRGSQPSCSRALRRVADEVVDLGRPEERGIRLHVLVPVEARVREGEVGELLHRMLLAGRDHVVLGLSAWSISHIAST